MLDKIRNLPRITRIFIFIISLVLWYVFMTTVIEGEGPKGTGSSIKTGWIISGVLIAVYYHLLFPTKKS